MLKNLKTRYQKLLSILTYSSNNKNTGKCNKYSIAGSES